MKKRISFALTLMLMIAFTSCEKCDTECNQLEAKIIRYDCDRVIFQLLTAETIGDAVWEDVQTGERYNNVVSYYNTCNIAKWTNGKKTTLYVTLKQPSAESLPPGCYHCEALSQFPPQTKVDFAGVSTARCEVGTH